LAISRSAKTFTSSPQHVDAGAVKLLALTEFYNLTEATVLIEDWRIGYNTERPHSSLGNLTPVEFHRAWIEPHQLAMALS
jgi:transposase InsO family protein